MKNLFFGGSSEISIKLAKISHDIYNISRKRNKKFKKNFILKDYSETELSKKLKLLKRTKFDNIMIFNGIFGQSFLSNYSHKEFRKILNINLEIPLLISSLCISEKILNPIFDPKCFLFIFFIKFILKELLFFIFKL